MGFNEDGPAATTDRQAARAYQTGDPERFKKASSALAAGKAQEFSDETRVFRKDKAGERVEDRHGRELHAFLLSCMADWNTRVQLTGR